MSATSFATSPDDAGSLARRPTYMVLADELEHQVALLHAGDRLPSEHDLVDAHGVSRLTARAAMQELESRLLVRRVRGAGTFVARRIDYLVGSAMPPSASTQIRAAGAVPGSEILTLLTGLPSTDVQRALDLGTGEPVVTVTRLRTVDGLLAAHTTSHLPADLVQGLAAALDPAGSLHEALCGPLGREPRRCWARAELIVLPVEVAPLIGFEGRPLAWYLESSNRDERSGRLLELSRTWMRTDTFRIRFELGAA